MATLTQLEQISDTVWEIPVSYKQGMLVPAGVGLAGFLRISKSEFRDILVEGSHWCVAHGYGWPEDLERTEENGRISEADPDKISNRAVERGLDQIGTLGSGNHYLEIQR